MNNKLQGKDLINIGIFTAIYFIVIFAAASIGFIPIFIPLISVIERCHRAAHSRPAPRWLIS